MKPGSLMKPRVEGVTRRSRSERRGAVPSAVKVSVTSLRLTPGGWLPKERPLRAMTFTSMTSGRCRRCVPCRGCGAVPLVGYENTKMRAFHGEMLIALVKVGPPPGWALPSGPSDPDVEENERKKTNPGHGPGWIAASTRSVHLRLFVVRVMKIFI